MKIAGIQKVSLIDYPNKISSVVFAQGCNMNCSFCHNKSLIKNDANAKNISEDEFFNILRSRIGLIDAVVVSGGEPTLQKDLKDFIRKIKALGFLVKLDTNGTNPKLLQELVANELVDYIAMDIKAPLPKYSSVCRVPVNIENIEKSISILQGNRIPYEFRTTYTHELDQTDILDIVHNLIKGAEKYVLQQCRSIDENTGLYTGNNIQRPIDIDTLKDMAENIHIIDIRGDFVLSGDKDRVLSKDNLPDILRNKRHKECIEL